MPLRQYLTQLGQPIIEEAFSGLKTITRIYEVNAKGLAVGQVDTEILRAYGTADDEFAAALLTRRNMEPISGEKSGYITRLTEVYQEFTDDMKVSVGEDSVIKLEDGRTTQVKRYVSLASDAETLAAAIGDVSGGLACSNVEINKRGVGAEIVETYISAGQLRTAYSQKNNGKLEVWTLTHFNEVPTTPSGFILIDENVSGPEGIETYTYTYAKGSGEISRSVDYGQSEDQGTTGVTRTVIRHLTASSVNTDPTSLSGSEKIGEDKVDQDGYRIWTVSYAKGTGLVAVAIAQRQDGLREVTYVSLGSRQAPDGVVIRDDYRIENGYTVFTVSSIQEADGGSSPTSAEVVFERYVPFTYPGRAKSYSATVNGRTFVDVFLSPPVTTDVKATITVSYQTSNAIGTVSNLWNPKGWATLQAAWVGLGNNPQNEVRALPGYRSVSTTAVEATASVVGDGTSLSCRGYTVFGGAKGQVRVYGGPDDPGGDTLTLDVTVEPAFVATNGTVYYRKTVVEAAIPAQDALPV